MTTLASGLKVELRGRPRKGETATQAKARKIRRAKYLAKKGV